MNMDENKEYSVDEVAEIFKVHPNTVRSFIYIGILEGTQLTESAEGDPLGRNAEWSFTQKDLDRLRENLAKHAREKYEAEMSQYRKKNE